MEYRVTDNIPPEDVAEMNELLHTSLDGFVGQAYNYDDHTLTEDWMLRFSDNASNGPSQDDVIRTQIGGLMEIMLAQVQDKVCTEAGVLRRDPLGLGSDLKEVPVWGIDSYTRRMVEIALEDNIPPEKRSANQIKKFIERKLLPAINDQPPEKAHNMYHSLNAIFLVSSKTLTLIMQCVM